MEIAIIKVYSSRSIDVELISTEADSEDLSNLRTGEYALVKIESLNDRIAVEEFIDNLKK